MSHSRKELEVKFAVPGLEPWIDRLQELGAHQVQPRLHEVNLRFDAPDGSLERNRQVLRLRQDAGARLTYKGPGQVVDGIHQRVELEFSVSDYGTARAFLEALGYQVSWMYEKYRQAYALDEVTVTLDEMPFGNFLEIEGLHAAGIQAAARRLGLDWEQRILVSYAVLFERVRRFMRLNFRDLSFANFDGLDVPPLAFTD